MLMNSRKIWSTNEKRKYKHKGGWIDNEKNKKWQTQLHQNIILLKTKTRPNVCQNPLNGYDHGDADTSFATITKLINHGYECERISRTVRSIYDLTHYFYSDTTSILRLFLRKIMVCADFLCASLFILFHLLSRFVLFVLLRVIKLMSHQWWCCALGGKRHLAF
jgi:hypothetical protein